MRTQVLVFLLLVAAIKVFSASTGTDMEPPMVNEKDFTEFTEPRHGGERIAPCNSWVWFPAGYSVQFRVKHHARRCHWLFAAYGVGVQLEITCRDFELRQAHHHYCYSLFNDRLHIFTTKYRRPQTFCGNSGPQHTMSVNQWLYVLFSPSLFSFSNYVGFTCTVTAVGPTTTISTSTTTTTPTTTTTTTTPTTTATTTTTSTTTTTPTTTTTTPTTTTPTTTTTTPTTTTTTPTTTTTTTTPTTTTTTTTPTTTTTATTTPEPCKCGRKGAPATTRIVGGADAGVHEFPWQCAMVLKTDRSRVICGAVLINSQYVATAAHCVAAPGTAANSEIVCGEHDTSRTDETTETIYRDINSIISRPDYDITTQDNDLALIRLSSPIDLEASDALKPICLPDPTNSYVNVEATVTGWGLLSVVGAQPDVLQQVNVTTMTNTACDALYSNRDITTNMICAAENGKDSCQGDSGGALITQNGDHYVVIGLVSFGILCANPSFPGVYTRVGNYVDWINFNVGNAQTCMV